ncbi:MAG TPA: response regulator, partial [Desulfotomaculum sp.]|nr:response regulator [Desulfotomaculum sp.]
MTPIRVLLVDDSALIRRVITRLLESRGEFQIIDTAVDGEEAVRKICALKPDVVSLDLEMPVLDGLGVLRRVMRQCPVPVVMLSSLTTAGAQATMQALSLGAVDFVAKPSRPGQLDAMVNELAEKLRTAAGVNTGRLLRTLLQKAMTHRPAEEKGAADHDAAAAGPAAVSPAAREEEKQPVSSSPPVATGP